MKKLFFSFLVFIILPGTMLAQTVTITLWKDSAIGAVYNKATSSVAYGKKDRNGYYKIYISDSAGKNEKRLSFPGWREDRHQWAEEWYPSGDYLFCYIEKADYVKEKKHKRKPTDAIPGYGGYTDLWLVKRDGSQAWPLTNLANNYNTGIIHSAISQDGTMFAWSERIKAPKFGDMNMAAGSYVIRVADFVLDSVPHFTNIRTFQPGGVDAANELDAISPDKTTITFYSTFESKNLFATPVYALDITNGTIRKLTTESFAQAPTYSPDGKYIVYMTGAGCDIFPFEIQGADWWIMNPDGSNKHRLTFMNKKNHPHSVNHYRLCGSISFIDNNTFLGGVMTHPLGLTGYTVMVRFTDIPQE